VNAAKQQFYSCAFWPQQHTAHSIGCHRSLCLFCESTIAEVGFVQRDAGRVQSATECRVHGMLAFTSFTMLDVAFQSIVWRYEEGIYKHYKQPQETEYNV